MTKGRDVVRHLACLMPLSALMHLFSCPSCSEVESSVSSGRFLCKGKWAATSILSRAWRFEAGRRKQVQLSYIFRKWEKEQ